VTARALLALLFCSAVSATANAQEGPAEEPPPTAADSPTVGVVPPPTDRAARDRWLSGRIDALLTARPELAATRVGIAVLDVASGKPVYRRNADQTFNIASNVKVVTTAAALALLGPEYRYKTQVFADQLDASGTVTGNLYLRTVGDPSLDHTALWSLANELAIIGVKKVTGALIIDDSFFDTDSTPPAFDQKKEDAYFRAPVGAASLDYNAVTVWVQPGAKPGQPARIAASPSSDAVTVKSTVVTVGKGRTAVDALAVASPTGTEVTVSGQIRWDDLGGEAFRKRIDRPTAFTGSAFRLILARAGIRVTKDLRTGVVPKTARTVVSHASEPIGVLVRDMMKTSNNFMAETIMKTIGAEVAGAPGTWAKGVAAVAGWLEETVHLPHGSFRYENGSGLYDSNRFSPDAVVAILRAGAHDFRTGAEYLSAMAIAGADGTLVRRMGGTAAERYVRAKSGSLKNVSCLSGFAGGTGRPLAFAVLVNDIPDTGPAGRSARSLQDEIAVALAQYVDVGD
jgi:D-alanyl-D-alanine carboxypeptidase/D-alanyl-D-alanine-endopeptidase (penicillin-binding protein 4)